MVVSNSLIGLDINQIKRSISSLRDRLFFEFIYESGCSVSELVSLRVEDVDLDNGLLFICTDNKKRTVSLRKQFVGDVKRYLSSTSKESCDYIFTTRQSGQISARRIQQLFKDYSEKIRFTVTPSLLRRYYIEEILRNEDTVSAVEHKVGVQNIKKMHVLSDRAVKMLLNKTKDERDWIIVSILYETGCTVNELVNIGVDDISDSVIAISHSRMVSISSNLNQTIGRYLKDNDLRSGNYLLFGRQSMQLSPRRIQQILQMYAGVLKIEQLHPHILRYSHIYNAIQNGKTIEEIERDLGIKNLRTQYHLFTQVK